MKRVISQLLALLFIAFSTTSCLQSNSKIEDVDHEPEYKASFLEISEPSASVMGEVITSFDKISEQISYLEDRSNYMVSDINNTRHYTLYISGDLLLNSKINILCVTSGIEGLEEFSSEMTVEKIDSSNGLIWIWSSEKMSGFVLKFYI